MLNNILARGLLLDADALNGSAAAVETVPTVDELAAIIDAKTGVKPASEEPVAEVTAADAAVDSAAETADVEAAAETEAEPGPEEPESTDDIQPEKTDEKLHYYTKSKSAVLLEAHKFSKELRQIDPEISADTVRTALESQNVLDNLMTDLQLGDDAGVGSVLTMLSQYAPAGLSKIAQVFSDPATAEQVNPKLGQMVEQRQLQAARSILQSMVQRAAADDVRKVFDFTLRQFDTLYKDGAPVDNQPRVTEQMREDDPRFAELQSRLAKYEQREMYQQQAAEQQWANATRANALKTAQASVQEYIKKYLGEKASPLILEGARGRLLNAVAEAYQHNGQKRSEEANLYRRARLVPLGQRENIVKSISGIHRAIAQQVLQSKGPEIVKQAGVKFAEDANARADRAKAAATRKPVGSPGAALAQSVVKMPDYSKMSEADIEKNLISRLTETASA